MAVQGIPGVLPPPGSPSGALWNGGAGWEPIGRSHADSFIGSRDGNGFKITGLFIDRGEEDQVGLFGWDGFGAQLSGLALEEVDITGASLVSALVVTNSYCNIETSGQQGSWGGGAGLTSNQMRQQESSAGFDFDVIWQLRNSPFPVLSANPQDTPPVPGGNAPAFVPPGTDLTGKLPAHRWTVGDGRMAH